MVNNVEPTPLVWTPARVYAGYRIVLAVLLVTLYSLAPSSVLGSNSQPNLFIGTAAIYLLLTLVSTTLMSPLRRLFPQWASLLPVMVDVLLLTALIHASGGIKSNLSVLLMVTVAAASILLPGRGGLLVAAIASISVIFEQFMFSIQEHNENPWLLTESAMLGLGFFVTAIIIHQIAQRLASSEALTETQQKAISQLEELNNQIVQRMRTGILVFDGDNRIVLANKAAEELLPALPANNPNNPAKGSSNTRIAEVPAALVNLRKQWLDNPVQSRPAIQLTPGGATTLVRFARLKHAEQSLTLTFLEDQRQLAQEAQQLKLASLGRMSATIAHEIRNPLSAISHAAGLLAEASLEDGDRRLLDIVQNHVRRVNGIIDDILNLSRRPAGAAERLNLRDISEKVRQHWQQHEPTHAAQLTFSIPDNVIIRFDPGQLEQVLHNLISNAFRHGGDGTTVTVKADSNTHSGLPWMRVSDSGNGIDESARPHLFEPFFTTSRQGTGLGLFVCRELCEANQAQLDLEPSTEGASFMITFAHPDRVFE